MLNFLRQLLKFNTSHLFGCHYWNRNYLSIRKHPSLSPLLHVLVWSVLFSCQIICFYVCKTVLWRTYYSSVKKMFCFFHSHVFGMGFMLKIANCIKWLNTEFWSLTSKYIENRCIPHTCNKHILIIIHIYILLPRYFHRCHINNWEDLAIITWFDLIQYTHEIFLSTSPCLYFPMIAPFPQA